ncbi:hypothetical protein LPUS_01359 [Lasallia pustulata]|uniref:Uncharacterized protein n=1 Tax=Lasallia pustulata TaxID=136370 RepID=A0A1W5CSV1_9LECA|nr:hypothetical protein LPUS_01359 [Lasallia pustulata]
MERSSPAVEAPPSTQDPIQSTDEISSKFETPSPQAFVSFNALKDRIRQHYELCSDYYYSLW